MEERLKTSSVVPELLQACANPRRVSAPWTRRCLTASDRIYFDALSLRFGVKCAAPFHSGAAVEATPLPSGPTLTRLRLGPSRLISEHHRSRQRSDDLRRARSPFCGLPCDVPRSSIPCVLTDFCFPLLRLRVPAPRTFSASLRGLRLARDLRPYSHRPRDRGTWRFTTPDPLWRARSDWRRTYYFPRFRRTEPLTLLSLPRLCRCPFGATTVCGGQDRFANPSVTIRLPLRSEVPSLGGGTRAPARLRGLWLISMRSRDVFRTDPTPGILSQAAKPRVLSHHDPVALLDSRPRSSVPSGERTDARFSESDTVHRLLQNTLRRATTPKRATYPHYAQTAAFRRARALAFASRPSPFEDVRPHSHLLPKAAGSESRKTRRSSSPGAVRTPRDSIPYDHRFPCSPLAGSAQTQSPFAGAAD